MLADWQRQFPGCEPVPHWLRTAFPDRWVRFHSLPGSKRYPHSDAEYAIILDRHNRVMAELTEAGNPVVLLSAGYSESTDPVRDEARWRALDPDAIPWRTVVYDAADLLYWHVFASERKWAPGGFDPIVRLVADDVRANMMIVAPDCRWLLAPYDGGMDLSMDTRDRRDYLQGRFADWLSARPDGL